MEIIRETDSAAIEVLDKKTKSGERGLLRFDNNNNLRYYAFLYNVLAAFLQANTTDLFDTPCSAFQLKVLHQFLLLLLDINDL